MMKKAFAAIILFIGAALSAADPYFTLAVKHVDSDGEALNYRNLTRVTTRIEQLVAGSLYRICPGDDAQNTAIRNGVTAAFKLLDLTSFKAMATSSVELGPETFLYKDYVVVAKNSKSILVNKSARDLPLDHLELPADTRIAISMDVDLGRIWQRVKEEVAATKDAELNDLLAQAERLKDHGIDLDRLMAAMSGRFLLLVSGDSLETLGLRLDIPDKDGSLSAQLRMFMPTAEGSNMVQLPLPLESTPFGVPQLVYAPGRIQLVSDAKVLKPARKLGSVPVFGNFAKLMPKTGTGYIVIDFPKELLVALFRAAETDLSALDIPSLKLLAVGYADQDGVGTVAASNVSLPTLATTAPIMLQTAILAPALRKAQDRARTLNKMNDLKQIGLALLMYAQDHQEKFPPENGQAGLNALAQGGYIQEGLLAGKIFIGGGLDLKKLDSPSARPVAFDAPDGKAGTVNVNVLFADGHVDVIAVRNYTDPKQVIGALHQKRNFAPEKLQDLLRRLVTK